MATFREIKSREEDLEVLRTFLENAGNSLETFRYFRTRDLSAISEHVLTVLGMEDGVPCSYGHLDPENDVVWLGICVAQNAAGKGHGKSMMTYLIDFARNHKIPEIYLKVDADNSRAVSLYHKFGFEDVEHSPNLFYIMRRIVQGPDQMESEALRDHG